MRPMWEPKALGGGGSKAHRRPAIVDSESFCEFFAGLFGDRINPLLLDNRCLLKGDLRFEHNFNGIQNFLSCF